MSSLGFGHLLEKYGALKFSVHSIKAANLTFRNLFLQPAMLKT
jgi:hypothetical protein